MGLFAQAAMPTMAQPFMWPEESKRGVFLRQLAKAKARAEPVPRLKLELRGCTGGALFWHVAAQGRSGCLCWKSEDSEATVPLPPRRRSWGNSVRPGLLREAAGVVRMRDSLYGPLLTLCARKKKGRVV